MLGNHVYDPEFANCSSELKKILSASNNIPNGCCIDMPCGNGRNIFLLTSFFKKVIGVDINGSYLHNIEECCADYKIPVQSIVLQKLDITMEIPIDIKKADLISTIHFYNYAFLTRIISEMRSGAFFYIESPSCAGGNYRQLPNEKELDFLLKGAEVLLYKSNVCESPGQTVKSISFKILLKKIDD